VLALLMAAAVTWGGFEDFPQATPEMRAMPLGVRTLIERRAYCNHWWGEYAYDGPRGRQINEALRELRCSTVAREDRRLRRRYAKAPGILKALDETRDWLP
jgi:hypothetical protein